jgi:glycosyltransferase involved in cell wall biosynthesis
LTRELPIPLAPLAGDALVSVLMANYNYAAFVGAAIESVLQQTYPHVELVVCDDGSSDASPDIIRGYAARDPRVRFLSQERRGGTAATNLAYRHARGAVLCLLDSDDLFMPNKVELVVAALRAQPAGLLVHGMVTVDETGRPLERLSGALLEEGWLAPTLQRRGGRWAWPPSSALCFRRECAPYLFPLPEDLTYAQDKVINSLLPLLTPVTALDEALSLYRSHGANVWFGRRQDAALLAEWVDLDERVCRVVNERLAASGITGVTLDVARDLDYQEHRLRLALLRGGTGRGELWRDYRWLARAVLADDLMSRAGKARVLLGLALAVPLPTSWRSGWLAALARTSVEAKRWLAGLRRRGMGPAP